MNFLEFGGNWYGLQSMSVLKMTCGYCGNAVGSERGYKLGTQKDGSGAAVGGI